MSGHMEERNGPLLATFGRRLAAYLLDQILVCLPPTVFLVTTGFGFFLGLTGHQGTFLGLDDELFFFLFLLILIGSPVVVVAYGIWWVIALRHGKTPGKQLTGIQVIKGNTEYTSWCRMFLRELIKGLPAFLALGSTFLVGGGLIPRVGLTEGWAENPVVMIAGIYWLVDNLWPLFDENSRAIHDIIAGTIVVRD